MTFIEALIEALRSGRPMKRRGTLLPTLWLRLVMLSPENRPMWLVVGPSGDAGPRVGLTRDDYLAEDWELAPEAP